jgi:RNA polymerase sigma-70 factor (ECF subfamily)
MVMHPKVTAESLEPYRVYLRFLAGVHLNPRLARKVVASDLVKQTFLHAYQALDQFRGQTEPELARWLRQILARNLAHVARGLGRAKRDVGREESLEAALDTSSARLDAWLAADQSSPSQQADRNEQILRLAKALETLPETQREAIVLHYWHDWTVAEIGQHLGRSPAAVAGLLKRGLKQLREQMRKTR